MFDFLSFLVGLLTAAVVFLGLEVHNLKAKIVVTPVEEAPVEEAPVEEAPVEEVQPSDVDEREECHICRQPETRCHPLRGPIFGKSICVKCEYYFHRHMDRAFDEHFEDQKEAADAWEYGYVEEYEKSFRERHPEFPRSRGRGNLPSYSDQE